VSCIPSETQSRRRSTAVSCYGRALKISRLAPFHPTNRFRPPAVLPQDKEIIMIARMPRLARASAKEPPTGPPNRVKARRKLETYRKRSRAESKWRRPPRRALRRRKPSLQNALLGRGDRRCEIKRPLRDCGRIEGRHGRTDQEPRAPESCCSRLPVHDAITFRANSRGAQEARAPDGGNAAVRGRAGPCSRLPPEDGLTARAAPHRARWCGQLSGTTRRAFRSVPSPGTQRSSEPCY